VAYGAEMRRFDADTTGAFRLLALLLSIVDFSDRKKIIFMIFTK
jgi:hypothetical protein